MDRAERALEAAWPERTGRGYVETMEAAATELQAVAAEMQASAVDPIEESRTYRYLGSIYSDLAPVRGEQMLLQARDAYQRAESLIEGHDDALEQAKLDFNFANTLRQLGKDDSRQLGDAERRFLPPAKFSRNGRLSTWRLWTRPCRLPDVFNR